MAMIAPNSEIYIIKCPIELDNNNQLRFATATAQHNYFNGLPKLSLTNATFQRKDGTIRWPGSMESIIEYNYCMYRNKNHGNKWFYAFIDDMKYINDNTTAIKIRTDSWQTWQFDLSWKSSYVEREHVNDDTIGLHTIPEGLDTGEYVCNTISKEYYAKRQYYNPSDPTAKGVPIVCIQLTTLSVQYSGQTVEPSNKPTRNIINGVPQGTYTIGIPYNKDSLVAIYMLTNLYDAAGRGDAIISMFMCPREVSNWEPLTGNGIWGQGLYYKPADSDTAFSNTLVEVTMPTTLDGYTPKNNKCFVSPYNYFHINNGCGTDIEYYYEDFNSTPTFSMYGSLEQGGSMSFIPLNSKRTSGTPVSGSGYISSGFSEGVMAGKLPQLSWTSDYYLNWVAQNGKNIAIQTGLAAAGFATNAISGMVGAGYNNAMMRETAVQRGYFPDEEKMVSPNAGGQIGGVFSFASQIANTMNTIRQAKMVPPQAKGNVSSGSLQFAINDCAFTIFTMSCRAEYIKCIDDYFSAYGYKVNSYKIPNLTGRANWNYVKTVGCNITGDLPQSDIQDIKSMFDNGVTLWHNPSTFLDYSQNNAIV